MEIATIRLPRDPVAVPSAYTVEAESSGNHHPAEMATYLTKIARLGGYLARASDPPPGDTFMWRGLTRLTDIKLGAMLAASACG